MPVKATLLAYNEGPVWRVGNEIITGMGADRYIFPDLPENLYSKPTLVWLLENRRAGEQTVEASYLTNQVNWNADYVLTVAPDQKAADLNGWVTIVNQQRDSLRERPAPTRGGRIAPRLRAEAVMAWRMMAMKAAEAPAPQFARGRPSPNIISTRSSAAPTSRTTKPSRSACSLPPASALRRCSRSTGSSTTTTTAAPRGADQRAGQGPHQVQELGGQLAGHAAPRRHGARLPGRFEGPRAVHRRGPDRPHAEG